MCNTPWLLSPESIHGIFAAHFFLVQKSTPSAESNHGHLQRPYASDPNLELTLDAVDIVELNALPPASSRGLAPKQQELLRHTHRIVAQVAAADVASQPGQRQATNDGLVGLAGSVAPAVVVVETTAEGLACSSHVQMAIGAYPAVSISIRCASVVPGSSLRFRPEKMPSCFWRACAAALLTLIISALVMSALGGMT